MRRALFALLILPFAACSGTRSIDEEPPIVFALDNAEKLIWYRGDKMEITFTYESQAIGPVNVKIPEDFSGGLEISKPVNGNEPPAGHTPDVLEAAEDKSFSEPIVMQKRQVREGGTWDVSDTLEKKLSKDDQIVYVRYRLGVKTTPWYKLTCIRRYKADVETTLGTLTLDFLPEVAPRNVMTFVKRAKEGFYDGTPIFHVEKGSHCVFGDASREGVETVPQEPGHSSEGFGTVGMWYDLKPDSISHLVMIRFKERPMPMNRFTLFATVTGGEDVLRKIEAAEVEGHAPKEPISIVKISIGTR